MTVEEKIDKIIDWVISTTHEDWEYVNSHIFSLADTYGIEMKLLDIGNSVIILQSGGEDIYDTRNDRRLSRFFFGKLKELKQAEDLKKRETNLDKLIEITSKYKS